MYVKRGCFCPSPTLNDGCRSEVYRALCLGSRGFGPRRFRAAFCFAPFIRKCYSQQALRRNGVERYAKAGEKYDPHLHDAIQESDDVSGEPGSIVRVLRYGYRTSERVIRPAQVILKKHG